MMATIYYCQEEGCPVSMTLQGGEMTTSTVKVHHNTMMKAVQVDQKILKRAQQFHRLYCIAHGDITSEHVMREVAAAWDELGRARQEIFFREARAEREEARKQPEDPPIQIDIQNIRDLVSMDCHQENAHLATELKRAYGPFHPDLFVQTSVFV